MRESRMLHIFRVFIYDCTICEAGERMFINMNRSQPKVFDNRTENTAREAHTHTRVNFSSFRLQNGIVDAFYYIFFCRLRASARHNNTFCGTARTLAGRHGKSAFIYHHRTMHTTTAHGQCTRDAFRVRINLG